MRTMARVRGVMSARASETEGRKDGAEVGRGTVLRLRRVRVMELGRKGIGEDKESDQQWRFQGMGE